MTIRLEPSKRPEEIRRYRHVWTPFLGTDTIVSQHTVGTDINVTAAIETGNQSVKFTVSGGTLGVPGRITHTITTFAGDVETEEFIIEISADEPVSLAEARAQVNIIDAADTTYDVFLSSLILAARATVERISRFFWVPASRSEAFGAWGDDQFLQIYRRPIASVDTITYTDQDGNDATYDAFLAPLDRFPLRVYPAIDGSFPALGRGGLIKVDYTSAALDIGSEEYLLGKRAMLLLIGHWFANREGVIADLRAAVADVPWAITELLDDLRPVSAY